MPATFVLVLLLVLLALVGPLLAVGLLISAFSSAGRPWALMALRFGLAGAVTGLAADVLLHLAMNSGVSMMSLEGILVATGAGFTLGVVAGAVISISRSAVPGPELR